MNHKKNITSIFLILLLSSCSIYYTTSELDSNLKKYINSINKNQKIIADGFNKLEYEFTKLKYTGNEEPFVSAIIKLKSLSHSSENILNLKISSNNEYSSFKKYSKNTTKILSGSDDWKKLKLTKNAIKKFQKDLIKESKVFNKLSEEYQIIMNEQISPLVKIYKVSEFQNNYQQIIISINNLKKEIKEELIKYQNIYADLYIQYSVKYPEKCRQLKLHLSNSNDKIDNISYGEDQIRKLFIEFNNKTKGVIEIYSTSNLWDNIEKIDNNMKKKLSAIQKTQKEIKQYLGSFQAVANQMRAQ